MRGNQGKVIAMTQNFTVDTVRHPSGTCFTNRGAVGNVIATLPILSDIDAWRGYTYEFRGVADQSFAFSAATAGKAVALNNAACTSLAMQTAGQKIGGHLMAEWDGKSWCLSALYGAGTVA